MVLQQCKMPRIQSMNKKRHMIRRIMQLSLETPINLRVILRGCSIYWDRGIVSLGGRVLTVLGRPDLLFKMYFHICPYITDLSRKFAFHINDSQFRVGRFVIHCYYREVDILQFLLCRRCDRHTTARLFRCPVRFKSRLIDLAPVSP